ncbi:Eukaryotic translation initiation factor 4E-binding protein 1 [Echinococcus granulosus]|uniref:Eukaryotic translation initiation factor 4E n=1 Tax=Echinococcus granulosus TaxID=6210 RepID=U6JQ01_ECHGR|nr:Eukaryotic translation initiation factor 4E-binding protein [Echinococcus granulosus]EUB56815.1 Eukaryotic translation initiation factor 4E-binding protein [Echinococcus granulosus]KAH9278447.1 Eukaryotic translation initiation factor 4E-binding protein 1 [Echinococcus granulosus]CDS23922.1 eukaryotic translation initiation factor 4E [Echinococcus granulosus]
MAANRGPDGIPFRRLKVTDPSQIPNEYSTTPGGSIFSTTPGGTRIFYDRDTMLMCKNSPIARSPPTDMVCRPGITCPATCAGECHLPAATAQKPTKNTHQEHASVQKSDEGPFDIDL